MRINRKLAGITSLVTILSLVFSSVEILSKVPKLWYIILIVTGLTTCIHICLLPNLRNIPSRETSLLSREISNHMVMTAVGPNDYPLCTHLTSIHTNGTVIAALIAQAVYINIKELQMMMNREQVEMGELEDAYSVDAVETHLKILRSIHSIAANMISRGSLLSECYRIIPGTQKICKGLRRLNLRFENNVIKRLEDFLNNIHGSVNRREEDERWKEAIRNLLNSEIPTKLADLIRILLQIEEPARTLMETLKKDWEQDLRRLWEDSLCKPRREVVPLKPRLATDSIPAYVDMWAGDLKKKYKTDK